MAHATHGRSRCAGLYSQPQIAENVLELVYFEDLPLGGEWSTRRRTITSADLTAFVGLSGDYNPLYADVEHARSGHFGEPIVPGALVAAVTIGLGAMDVPVPATVGLVGMTWKFVRPVRPGDTIRSRWRLNRKRPVANLRWGLAVWQIEVENQSGEVVASAEVTRLITRREQPADMGRQGKRSRRRRRGAAEVPAAPGLPPKPMPGPLREPLLPPAAEPPAQPAPEPLRHVPEPPRPPSPLRPQVTPAPGHRPAAEGPTPPSAVPPGEAHPPSAAEPALEMEGAPAVVEPAAAGPRRRRRSSSRSRPPPEPASTMELPLQTGGALAAPASADTPASPGAAATWAATGPTTTEQEPPPRPRRRRRPRTPPRPTEPSPAPEPAAESPAQVALTGEAPAPASGPPDPTPSPSDDAVPPDGSSAGGLASVLRRLRGA